MTSVAQYDKDITKEIDSKLISHGSLNCRLSPFAKGKSQLSQNYKLQGNCHRSILNELLVI